MISAGDFKNGITVEYEGELYTIIDFQHVKPGKGAAFVRAKIKNIISGGTIEKTFRPNEKMKQAYIDRKDMQYLYSDDNFYNFMDVETYEQIGVSTEQIKEDMAFIKENETIKILSHNGKVFGIEPPMNVELEITETEPGVRGDTATNATKPATVETGEIINVPLFIDKGDIIKIDTRTGEYAGRA